MNKVKLSAIIGPAYKEAHKSLKNDPLLHYWCKGGRGSLKSSWVGSEIILGLIKDPNAHAVVLRKYAVDLRDSVYSQLEWCIHKMELGKFFRFQYSPLTITYIPTGQKILFRGVDDTEKMKSIKVGKGYIRYIWYEELTQFSGMEEVRNINQSLIRGDNPATVFYSYNPPQSGRAWVNAEAKIHRPDRMVIHTTYLQAPPEWLGQNFLIEAEHLRKVNETAWRHEYLGEETGTGGEVFKNVQLEAIPDELIRSFDHLRQGLDWGYASDPFNCVRMHLDKTRRRLYIFGEIHKVELSNRSAAEQIKANGWNDIEITADSAEPKSIAEMKNDYGLRIKGAVKGPGSVEHGIKWLADLEAIIIDPERCPNAAREFVNYSLEKDKNGNWKAGYPDKDNHSIDAARYGLEADMKSGGKLKTMGKSALGL